MRKSQINGTARSTTLPAPVGGWNAKDALADMPADHAVILDNWFAGTDRVTLRRGSSEHATGMSGNVETLLEYTGLDGSGELFACNGGEIYDVTAAGAIGAAVVTGLTNDRWQFVNMGTGAGQFLIAMNGADAPRNYNGTSWATTPAITGPTAANLIWCNVHQRRLWFGEEDSLAAYYLAVNNIGGAATSFSLAGIASRGGYIMAMGTMTRDSAEGGDDAAVFLTSEGEAIIYEGTDPSSASTWSLLGKATVGRPIGRRCMIQWGGDLILITEDGFIPASALLYERASRDRYAVSEQINKAVNDAVRSYSTNFGWQPVIYPRGTMLIFNIPQGANTYHQYVFNTITKAPCRFKGWNAVCWGKKDGNLYFGTADGRVMLADAGASDDGVAILGDGLQAFNYLGSPGVNKAVKLVNPIFESDGNPNAAIEINTDFQVKTFSTVSTPSTVTSARWGISKWGIGTWGTAAQIYSGWRGTRGIGKSIAPRVQVSSTQASPAWIATGITYVPGGMI